VVILSFRRPLRRLALEVVDPGVDLGAGALAGGELPLVAPEAEAALGLPAAAPGRPVLEVAAEHPGVVDGGQGLRVAGELNQLLAGDKVDVGQGQDGVDEVEESLDTVGAVVEPSGVEEEGEGGLGLGVVVEKVLGEDLLDGVGLLSVEAAVGHGAPASAHVQQGGHGDLPHLWMRHLGAGLDSARVGHGVLKGVGPAGAGHAH